MAGLCNSVFKLFEYVCVFLYTSVCMQRPQEDVIFSSLTLCSIVLRQDSHCELSILVRLAGWPTNSQDPPISTFYYICSAVKD